MRGALDLGEPVVDTRSARGSRAEQLGEVRLAKPGRDAVADLDADLRGEAVARRRRGEVDLAEPALADQPVEPVGAAALGAVRRRGSGDRRRRVRPTVQVTGIARAPAGGRRGLGGHPVESYRGRAQPATAVSFTYSIHAGTRRFICACSSARDAGESASKGSRRGIAPSCRGRRGAVSSSIGPVDLSLEVEPLEGGVHRVAHDAIALGRDAGRLRALGDRLILPLRLLRFTACLRGRGGFARAPVRLERARSRARGPWRTRRGQRR